MEKQMPKIPTMKKAIKVAFSLNDDVINKLRSIAEKSSNSLSSEVRRLINEEYERDNRKEN
jgi:predicted transcriptional regulator